jgi:hypothetical protein
VSIDVLREVLNHSRAKGTDRNVLVALADSANATGISWLPIMPPRYRGADPTKCITHRANCSKREAIRSVQELELGLGEIEVRKAQRGQRRISVYAVRVGSYAHAAINYDDLPFDLVEPFRPGANLAPRTGADSASLAGESGTPRGAGAVTPRGAESSPHEVPVPRARVNRDPSEDPSDKAAADPPTPSPRTLAHVDVDEPAAAAVPEPASIERTVASLATLPGWDSHSLGVVLPLAQQLPAKLFEQTLAKTTRRRAANPPGLLVHLLRVAIDDWRKQQSDARRASWDEFFGEAGLERVKRENPERYVLAWATPALEAARPLPALAVVGHVLDYLWQYVEPIGERLRLLELFMQACERQPAIEAIREWTLMALDRRRYSLDEVSRAIDTLAASEPVAREQLLAFAREVHANVEAERRVA